MSDVVELPAGLHASLRQIAEETGFDRDTVARKVSEASIAPSSKRGGHPVYRLRDVLPALYIHGSDGRTDPEKLDPFRRKAHYQAEAERLDLERQAGELIPRIEVEREQARVFVAIAQQLETLTDVVERDCGMNTEQIVRLEKAVNEIRELLYAELAAEDANGAAVRDSA